MGDFIIFALALNFFWLPALVNFLLDSLGIIGGDTERFDKSWRGMEIVVIRFVLNCLAGFLFR